MSSKRPRASLVDRVFDRKYRDSLNRATREVPLLHLLYLTCIPLSKACVRLRLSPTMISHGSNALAMLAVAALAWSDKPWLFPLLWIAALYLDIADGIVARVTNTATASGSFYDHMSDQVKVILVFLAAGLRYESTNVWILSFLVSAGFLFMNLVNQILALRTLRLSLGTANQVPDQPTGQVEEPAKGFRARVRSALCQHPGMRNVLVGAYASVFAMYGNSMLFVLPLGLGEVWAIATLIAFGIITLRSLAIILASTSHVNRQLGIHAIPWK